MIVVFAVILLLFGTKRLPELSCSLGKSLSKDNLDGGGTGSERSDVYQVTMKSIETLK